MQAGLAACTREPEAPPQTASCEDGKGDTNRTINLTLESPPIWQQLDAREVVLTFDDGPEPGKTGKVLDLLAANCAKAAFFLRGDAAEKYPDIVRNIVIAGHQVGGHGWAHASLTDMPIEDARAEIERSVTVINDALAASPETQNMRTRLFRFPYMNSNRELEQLMVELNLVPVPVHADGADWELTDPNEIVANVFRMLRKADDRGVILLHDPFDSSDEAVELLLRRLKDEGYRIVEIRGAE